MTKPSFAEAFRLWFKLGLINFGGPAAQIAMMHRMLVDEQRWIGETRFLHALNYCTLLPGQVHRGAEPGKEPRPKCLMPIAARG